MLFILNIYIKYNHLIKILAAFFKLNRYILKSDNLTLFLYFTDQMQILDK